MKRRVLAIVLVLAMVLTMVPTSVFAADTRSTETEETKPLNYVSFGASNVNGYGLSGYLDEGVTAETKDANNVYGYERMPEGSYPYLIAEALNEAAGGTKNTGNYTGNLTLQQPFTMVHADQLAMSSMRMEELRILLDETYYGDTYTAWRFYENGKEYTAGDGVVHPEDACQNWFYGAGNIAAGLDLNSTSLTKEEALAALRGAYADAVYNADLITIDMGINNFGVYMSMQQGVTPDFSETVADIDPELAEQYEQAKIYVRNVIAENMPELLALYDEQEFLIDSLAYALVGYCYSFDVVMGKIRELNQDATIVVVSIQNLLTDLNMIMGGTPVPMGDLFGMVINAANTYTASLSPYKDEYYYANVSENGRVEFFVDQLLAYNGDPTTLDQDMIDCYNVYDNDLRAKEQILGLVGDYLPMLVAQNVIIPMLQAEKVMVTLPTNVEEQNVSIAEIMAMIYGTTDSEALLSAYVADGMNGFAAATTKLTEAAVAGMITEGNAYAVLGVMQESLMAYAASGDADTLIATLTTTMTQIIVPKTTEESVEAVLPYIYSSALENVNSTEEQLAALLDAYLTDGAQNFAAAATILPAYAEQGVISGEDATKVLNVLRASYAAYGEAYSALEHSVLLIGYDVITEYFREAVELFTIDFSTMSMYATDLEQAMLGAVVTMATTALTNFANDPTYQFKIEDLYPDGVFETLAAQYGVDPLMLKSLACMAIRTGIGNSFFGHPNRNGHQEIADIILKAIENKITGDDVVKENIYNYATEFYNFLAYSDSYTTAEKVDLLEKLLAVVEGTGVLADYPEVETAVMIYAYLDGAGYIDAEQTMDIVLKVYGDLLNNKVDLAEIATFIYNELIATNDDADEAVAIIKATYSALKNSPYLAPYEKPLTVAESILALDELENVAAAQVIDIVNKVYNAVIDGDVSNAEIRAIAGYIYFDILKTEESAANSRLLFTAAEKIAIIEAVYDVLATNGYIDTEKYPELGAIKALYDDLTEDENPLISDEKVLEIIDLVVATLVEEETIDDAVITDLTVQISDKVLADDNIEPATKVEILKKVVATMKACNLGGEFTPYLDVVGALREALKAAGYMTDTQAGEIVEAIYPVLPKLVKGEELTEELIVEIAKEVFDIVFEQPGLTIQDKIAIVVIIYEVLDEYGYVDMAIAMGYAMGYAMAKENGYVDMVIGYIDIAIQSVDGVKNAVADFAVSSELAGVKAALLTEINATTETLMAIKALLESDILANVDNAWAAVLDLQAKMNQHIENLKALAMEIGFVADPYIADCFALFETLGTMIGRVDPAMGAAIKEAVSQLKDTATNILAQVSDIKSHYAVEIETLELLLAQQMQILSDKVAQLENATEEEAKAIIQAEINQIKATIAQVEESIAQYEQQLAEVGAKTEAVYNAILGVGTAVETMIDAGLNPGLVALQASLDDVAVALVDLAAAVDENLVVPTANAMSDIKTKLNNAYISNTTANYIVTDDSYYVALGDADAYGQSAELLAQALELVNSYANLTESNMSASALLSNIGTYAAEIGKADLITLGFSANNFTAFTASQVKLAMYEQPPVEMDWVALIGKEGAAKVAEVLAKMEVFFIEEGVPARYAPIMTLAIESYVFAYVTHMVDYVQVAQAIHTINPEALLVLVGMYNPLDGVILDLGESQIDLGQYVRYLVDATNVYTLGNAIVIPEAIYVDAPAVETSSTGAVIDVVNFIGELVYNPYALAAYMPTSAGFEYIMNQILTALNPTFELSGLLGDADSNGEVDNIDAMLILQYHTGVIEEDELDLSVCDVDNNGVVDNIDAMMVLQYHTGVITEFN